MNYNEAYAAHKVQWLSGKHKHTNEEHVFPYNCHYVEDTFIEVTVKFTQCTIQYVEKSLVNKYVISIQRGFDLGPSWAVFGKKLKNGDVIPFYHKQFYIVDGNHRMTARNILNKQIDIIVPESNYKEYKRNYNE